MDPSLMLIIAYCCTTCIPLLGWTSSQSHVWNYSHFSCWYNQSKQHVFCFGGSHHAKSSSYQGWFGLQGIVLWFEGWWMEDHQIPRYSACVVLSCCICQWPLRMPGRLCLSPFKREDFALAYLRSVKVLFCEWKSWADASDSNCWAHSPSAVCSWCEEGCTSLVWKSVWCRVSSSQVGHSCGQYPLARAFFLCHTNLIFLQASDFEAG